MVVMKKTRLILFNLMVLGGVLSGCATGSTSSPQVAATPATTHETQEIPPALQEPLKKTNLDGENLFRLLLAEIAAQRGNLTIAAQQYLAAAKASRDVDVIARAARVAVFARDEQSALEAAKLWVEESDSSEAHKLLATMYVRAGDAEKAGYHLEKVISLTDEKNAFLLVTSLLSKQRDKKTALMVMEKILEKRKNNPNALYAYGQLAQLLGELDKALDAALRLQAIKPEWAEAYMLNSNILARQGKHAESIGVLRDAVRNSEDDSALRYYYARKLIDEKQYPEAEKQFEILLKNDANHYEARYALGLLALQQRKFDKATASFEKLVKQGKRVDESSYYLGQIAQQQSNFDSAKRWYDTVTQGQYWFESQINMALIESREGKIDEARERLRQIEPQSAELELRLIMAEGEILREAKLYQEAFDLYSEALAKMQENVQILYARALTAEKIERLDVTLQDLETILKKDPNNAQALNAFGYTLVDKTDRVKEGLDYIAKAYKLQSDDAAIIDSLGWAHYRMGNYVDAIKFLRMAFEKLKDAEIAAHLGEVLWVSGDQAAARDVWDEALKATPSHQLLLDVIERFTK